MVNHKMKLHKNSSKKRRSVANRYFINLFFILTVLLAACSPATATPAATRQVKSQTPTVNNTAAPPPAPTKPPPFTPLVPTTTTLPTQVPPTATPEPTTSFAVIGDYGQVGKQEREVAALVHSWSPDFIITVGDNNYPDGAADTIDQNIGQYYHDYIYPYKGIYGPGAATNRFFPTLGNHDWLTDNAQPYFNYFTLPDNERYYSFVWGPVEFYAIDSDYHDPSGITATSPQAKWLQKALASSTSPWKIVYFHLPPYSSGSQHGSTPELQWPFKQWGASAVLSGHEHNYERLEEDGLVYFVDGLGGNGKYPFADKPAAGSQVRYNSEGGAMRVTASPTRIEFEFINVDHQVIDSYSIEQ